MQQQPEERRSLYQRIIDVLMERIQENRFSFEEPFCTEKQLMEEFQVSRITAKRAITELEYRGILYRRRGVGSFVARDILCRRRLEQKESRIFPLVLPFNATQVYILDMIQEINDQIGPAGCFLSLFITGHSSAREQGVLSQLLEQNPSGLLYYPCTGRLHLDLLNQFVMRNMPVIVLDQSITAPCLHNVLCDNFMGGRLLTEYLIAQGHTRIGYLSQSTPGSLASVNERFGGYLTAMQQAGLTLSPEDTIQGLRDAGSPEGCGRLAEQVRRLCRRGITAIECENDGVARSLINCCETLGIRVPEQLSVCGFDANDLHITSIYQNEKEMAREIGGIILKSLDGTLNEIRKVHVPVSLVVRSSTGPAPRQVG